MCGPFKYFLTYKKAKQAYVALLTPLLCNTITIHMKGSHHHTKTKIYDFIKPKLKHQKYQQKDPLKKLRKLGSGFRLSVFPAVVRMATSISAAGLQGGLGSSFKGCWGNSVVGEDYAQLIRSVPLPSQARAARPLRSQPMMKNVNEGKGLFAPIVVLTRDIVGKKRFNQLRGKAIALHSQVITEFCKSIGADAKQRQGLIRLAKKNGERLGFLA